MKEKLRTSGQPGTSQPSGRVSNLGRASIEDKWVTRKETAAAGGHTVGRDQAHSHTGGADSGGGPGDASTHLPFQELDMTRGFLRRKRVTHMTRK